MSLKLPGLKSMLAIPSRIVGVVVVMKSTLVSIFSFRW